MQLPKFSKDTSLQFIGTPISAQELEESSMHPISSQEESWFPGFYWTVRPSFNKHLKRSLTPPIGIWEGTWVFCFKWSGYRDSLTRNKVGFPWSGLNAGSSFMWQNERMSVSCVEILEETLVPRHIWTGVLTSLETSRGSWSSILQKLTRLDFSLKFIGIPVSLCKLEMDPWSPTSPPEVSVLSCQA